LGIFVLLMPWHANAAPRHEALVIGNGNYTSMPPLPGCLLSAHATAAALRNLGFNVTEREDASSGGTDAAIGEFSKLLAASPGAVAVVYLCAYAIGFNDRPFVLPVTAAVTRPADVLTQGVLAKSLLDALVRSGAGLALLALDLVPTPGATTVSGLDALLQATLPDPLGAIVASQLLPPDTPTPLATALVAKLRGPEVPISALLTGVREQLANAKSVTVAALRIPTELGYLAGAPAPPPAAPTIAPQPAQANLPDEDQMTEGDRRRVQAALVRLGYYAGQVDGRFGPDTRAAIRRYQHELDAAMTGRLTATQASKLVGGG
jgi:hypothetical protein